MLDEVAKLSKSPLGNPTGLATLKGKSDIHQSEKGSKAHLGKPRFHLKALEEAGIVRTYYGFGKRPRKFVEITEEGIGELKEVLKILKGVAGD